MIATVMRPLLNVYLSTDLPSTAPNGVLVTDKPPWCLFLALAAGAPTRQSRATASSAHSVARRVLAAVGTTVMEPPVVLTSWTRPARPGAHAGTRRRRSRSAPRPRSPT